MQFSCCLATRWARNKKKRVCPTKSSVPRPCRQDFSGTTDTRRIHQRNTLSTCRQATMKDPSPSCPAYLSDCGCHPFPPAQSILLRALQTQRERHWEKAWLRLSRCQL